jgi:hypothetical protein
MDDKLFSELQVLEGRVAEAIALVARKAAKKGWATKRRIDEVKKRAAADLARRDELYRLLQTRFVPCRKKA